MTLKKYLPQLIICSLILSLLLGCSPAPDPEAAEKATTYVDSMDTFMTLTAYGSKRNEALKAAADEIYRLNDMFSIGVDSSEIAIANSAGHASVSEETLDVIRCALHVNEITGGCFDITITPLMELWGFTTGVHSVPAAEKIEETLRHTGLDKLTVDEKNSEVTLTADAKIDLGGIAKGYTSQRIMDVYRKCGVTSGIVSLGGNVQCLGLKPDGSKWKVAIRKPWSSESSFAAIIEVEDCAVISSGGYERYFEDENGRIYCHILDPKTGYPVESDLDSVSVICKDGMLADGLSTALYIMGLDKACDFWRDNKDTFDIILIDTDGLLYASEGIYSSVLSDDAPILIE